MMNKIKIGNLLRYKKRIFKSNWKKTRITLYKHGSFLIGSESSSSQTLIKCQKESTLIIFGQHIKSIPKIPALPSGYEVDQLLAIGIIEQSRNTNGATSIIFYWFLTDTINDLFDWIIAFHNSLVIEPKPYMDDQDEQNQNQGDQLALGLMLAAGTYYSSHAIDAYDPPPVEMSHMPDCSFATDFSVCSGL